ncbi:hypothetical protein E2P86_09280 [Sphingobacterium psychroaquaticum]|uniref:hypothetical protein n=1 Tax=Sphingobacterium psychroaquaticum TaxID=561061 RepID=UPI00106ACE91|nr:hypothetical protein [Sphingobacterium psychroaquaticum]QBQ41337.1 hypothetical protein E2P86_09280 [Sphingobacterium psychroaquaticum]
MKTALFPLALVYSLFFTSATSGATSNQNGCAMTVTYAEMAFAKFKKAYKAKSIADAQSYLKDGILQATESSAYAIQDACNCPLAKNYALSAVTFGNNAKKADKLDELKKWAKKAMDASLDVLTATPNCGKGK